MLQIADEVLRAKGALENGDFSAATFSFSHICRSAKTALQAEQFALLTDLIFASLEVLLSAPGNGIKRLRASLDMVLKHFSGMASVVHGPEHPLAIILKALHKHASDEESPLLQLALLKAFLHCYEQVLGPYGLYPIHLKLKIIQHERDFSPSKIWNVVESCDQACGFDSAQSFRCFDFVASSWIRSRDPAGIAKTLRFVEQRMAMVKKPTLMDHYTRVSLDLKLRHCWISCEWHKAGDIMEFELIPFYERNYGKSSTIIVSLLNDLEYCLRQTENWDRRDEVMSWRQSIMERLEAEDNNDEEVL